MSDLTVELREGEWTFVDAAGFTTSLSEVGDEFADWWDDTLTDDPVGKTIAAIVQDTVPGQYGHVVVVRQVYTDGTTWAYYLGEETDR